jgi:F like protein
MAQPTTLPTADAQRQAAVAVFAQYEPPLYEAYLDMMLEWLAAVKVAMFAGGVARLGLVPDPMTVFSQGPKWAGLTAQYTADVAREVLSAPYKDLFADGTLFESRPFVRNWIAERETRLNKVPTEVFGLVSHIIDSATTNGASIPDVTAQVEQLFADTDVQRWKNRARTVARTEVVGAYNGGLHDAFAMIVDNDPGTVWVKRWLATEDARTRPDHVEADGQVVPFSQPFQVGDFHMQYPHDPGGPAQEVINCRCTVLLEIKNEPTRMDNRQYIGSSLSAAAGPGRCMYCDKTATKRVIWADGRAAIPVDDRHMSDARASVRKNNDEITTIHRWDGSKWVKADGGALAAPTTLMQAVCDDGSFCMQTHKPGLCKGQKRGQTEPGAQDETAKTPAQKAQIAVKGLSTALQQAMTVAAQNQATNPKLAAMARKAAAGYTKALRGHQQTLKQAAGVNAKAKAVGDQDTRQQDTLDKRAQRHRDSLKKRADAIINRRNEKAKLAKMSPKQRTAYHKAKAAKAKAQRQAQENKTLKEASRA